MPNLANLTDYDPMGNVTGVEPEADGVRRVYITGETGNSTEAAKPRLVDNIVNKLLGLNGEERYQLWPEKVVREGLGAAGDALAGKTPQWQVDPVTGDVHTSPQMIEGAQAMSALAGSGGLAGTTDATLGATPFLRPALKYKDRLYKGKEGQQHQDIIPDALYPEFQKMAMAGDDISHYNFGFVNDKGQFLTREKALEYGVNTGLVDPSAGKYGALTSTLLADSSKPGMAIEATAKAGKNIDWDLIKTAENSLTGDAAKAIDTWVGGDKDFMANGGEFGIWSPSPLKKALKNPETASQIEAVMKPIKDQLRAEHGDTITLYRSHGKLPEGAKPDRELLSFTSDRDFAEAHSGGGRTKEKKLFTEDEMKAKEKEFAEKGKVDIDKNTWLERQTFIGNNGEEIPYVAIMRKDGMVTDTDSPSAYMKDLNVWRSEDNAVRNSKLKNVYEAKIPIDDIVFATDRFGQKEFIVKNKDKKLLSSPVPIYENNENYKFTPVDGDPFKDEK